MIAPVEVTALTLEELSEKARMGIAKHRLKQASRERHGAAQCQFCGCRVSQKSSRVVRLLPKCKGGDDSLSNLALSCGICCRAKDRLTLEEWWDVLERQLRAVRIALTEQYCQNQMKEAAEMFPAA